MAKGFSFHWGESGEPPRYHPRVKLVGLKTDYRKRVVALAAQELVDFWSDHGLLCYVTHSGKWIPNDGIQDVRYAVTLSGKLIGGLFGRQNPKTKESILDFLIVSRETPERECILRTALHLFLQLGPQNEVRIWMYQSDTQIICAAYHELFEFVEMAHRTSTDFEDDIVVAIWRPPHSGPVNRIKALKKRQ